MANAKDGTLIRVRLTKNVQWVPDSQRKACAICDQPFGVMRRRHHCRLCGEVVCDPCSPNRVLQRNNSQVVRTCSCCYTIALQDKEKMVKDKAQPALSSKGPKGSNKNTGNRATNDTATSNQPAPPMQLERSASAGFLVEDFATAAPKDNARGSMLIHFLSLTVVVIAALLAVLNVMEPMKACGAGLWGVLCVLVVGKFLISNTSPSPPARASGGRKSEPAESAPPPPAYTDVVLSGDWVPSKMPDGKIGALLNDQLEVLRTLRGIDPVLDGFTLNGEKSGVKMYGKKGEGEQAAVNSFLGRGEVPYPVRAILDVLFAENPATPQELDDMFDSETVIQQISNQTWVSHRKYKTVLFVSPREFLLVCHWQVEKDGTVFVVARSVEPSDYTKFVPTKNYVLAEIGAGWTFTPKGNSTEINYLTASDLKGGMPSWVTNKVGESQPMQIDTIRKMLDKRNTTVYQPGGNRTIVSNAMQILCDKNTEASLKR